ncbi:MAG: HAD family phosphatase, partial [Clostridiaceae bacterium]|nr:HAD family phosphatase [Clostridiaceae bacterium]
MVEAIIFDLDGTLLDSMPMWQNFGRLYLKELGIEAKDKIDRDLFAMTPAQ